jgi:hypothetical protein
MHSKIADGDVAAMQVILEVSGSMIHNLARLMDENERMEEKHRRQSEAHDECQEREIKLDAENAKLLAALKPYVDADFEHPNNTSKADAHNARLTAARAVIATAPSSPITKEKTKMQNHDRQIEAIRSIIAHLESANNIARECELREINMITSSMLAALLSGEVAEKCLVNLVMALGPVTEKNLQLMQAQ